MVGMRTSLLWLTPKRLEKNWHRHIVLGSDGPVYLLIGSIFCCFIQVLCSKEVVHMPDLAHFNTLLDLLVPSRFNRGRHKDFLSMSYSQVTAEQFGKDIFSLEVLAQFPSFGVRFLILY